MRNHLAVLLACSLLTIHCGSGLVEGLKDIAVVQGEVAKAVHESNVNVNLNNEKYLTISLINSPLRVLTGDPKKAKAREIAEVAYRAFPHRERLERITVVFMEHRRYFLFLNYTDGRDSHSFKGSEFGVAASASSGA